MNDKLIALYASAMAFIKADRDEEGATAVEYALLVALIAVAIIGGVVIFGDWLGDFFESISGSIEGEMGE